MKEKICRHCGTKDNLRINKNGVIYNCCRKCYETIEIPDQIKKTNEAITKKYGVSDLGELRSQRSKLLPKKEKVIKEITCKYCGTIENLVKSSGSKRVINFPACKDHWEQYQKDKDASRKKSNIERFGCDHPMHVLELREKQTQSIHNRTEEDKQRILEKRRKTNIEKFGVDHPIKLEEIKKKRDDNFVEKYGVKNPMHSPEFKNRCFSKFRETYWPTLLKLLEEKKIKPHFDLEQYLVLDTKLFEYECTRCGKIFKSEGTEPQHIWCGCNQRRSFYEDEIIDWLKSLGISNISPNKKFYEKGRIRFEIDIFLPDINIGIDFHGLYYHSTFIVPPSYHQDKYNYFNEKGIEFIQIFENEWLSKKFIVQSIISNKLNLNKNNRIFARKCKIQNLSNKVYSNFLDENHIQGSTYADIKLGLFYNEELVFLMSFGKNRFKSDDDSYEIIRMATKKGITLVGGFNKLLKYFEDTYSPKKTISFVDVRYFRGDSYKHTGFVKDSLISPNYFYFKPENPTKLYNRMAFQKHKLKDKLSKFNPDLSESENMYLNGYLKIYDAGNLKMVKVY